MATICGFPRPQAEDRGASPVGRSSVGGLGGTKLAGGGRASEQHTRLGPALSRDPATFSAFSLRPETSGRETLGTSQNPGIWGAKEKDLHRASLHQPLAPLPTAISSSSLWCDAVAVRGPAVSSALANYCDVSAPLPGSLFGRFSRTTNLPPSLRP